MSVPLVRPDEETRRAILLLEVAAVVHDMRKLTPAFVSSQAEGVTHTYGRLEFERDYPLIPQHLASVVLTGPAGTPTLREIILATRGSSEPLAKLLRGLHGKAHYEKEAVGQKQPPGPAYAATPFGHESAMTLSERTAGSLGEYLTPDRLNSLGAGGSGRAEWLDAVRPLLTSGLAATQRAVNEVTLWDWGATVAVLMKPVAYVGYQTGQWAGQDYPLDDFQLVPLQIRADRMTLYGRSDRIADLLGVRKALDIAFLAARALLEETYALGNRLYHDETGEYYLVPNLNVADRSALGREIGNLFPTDLAPSVIFHEPITIGRLDSTETRRETAKQLVANPRRDRRPMAPDEEALGRLAEPWGGNRPTNAELCSVCRTRPAGYPRDEAAAGEPLPRWATSQKARERKVCRICLGRRGRRSEDWLREGGNGHTIWTDEVADQTGRLALFVGSLGLDDWLDGDHFHTLPADRTSPEGKIASPARLYRVAETARDFWQTVSDEIVPNITGRDPYRLEIDPGAALDLGHGHAYELRADGLELAVVWDATAKKFLTTENLAYFASRWDTSTESLDSRLAAGRMTIVEPSAFLTKSAERGAIDRPRISRTEEYLPSIPLLAEPGACMVLVPADKALDLCREVRQRYQQEFGRVADRLPLNLGLVFFRRRTPMSAVLDAGKRLLRRKGQVEAWSVAAQPQIEGTVPAWRLRLEKGNRCIEYTYPMDFDESAHDDDGRGGEDRYYPWLYTALPAGDAGTGTTCHVSDLKAGNTVYIWPGYFDFEYLDTTGRRFEVDYDRVDGRRTLRRTRPLLLHDLDRLSRVWGHMGNLKKTQKYQVIQTIEATRDAWYGPDPTAGGGDSTFQQFVRDTLGEAEWGSSGGWPRLSNDEREEMVEAGASGELTDWAEIHLEILKTNR